VNKDVYITTISIDIIIIN